MKHLLPLFLLLSSCASHSRPVAERVSCEVVRARCMTLVYKRRHQCGRLWGEVRDECHHEVDVRVNSCNSYCE